MLTDSSKRSNRISSIDVLRGLAAIAVTIYHISNGNGNFLPDKYWIKEIGKVGWAGVEIFFVISGFIIPYSMFKASYRVNHFFNFLLKRIIRIDPPFLISIFVVIFLNYVSTLSKYYHGTPFKLDFFGMLLHIGYLNQFFDKPWINPVYWTLAIEFQFYILIALIFPLINHSKWYLQYLTLIVLAILGLFVLSNNYIFHYIDYFLIGILCFLHKSDQLKSIPLHFFVIFLLSHIYWVNGIVPCIATLISFTLITHFTYFKNKVFLFLGTISYSLYLIHVPIGGRIINLNFNFAKTLNMKLGFFFLAIGLSILSAYIFYLLIEKPFLKLSAKLKIS